MHNVLRPDRYLEIGVRHGASLELAQCHAIGVDPLPPIRPPLDFAEIFQETSDMFFEIDAGQALAHPPDMVFIDGMHLFENALRDFMNVEHHSTATTIVVIDDVFPNHSVQATRIRRTNAWCGDVWTLVPCLARYRPDLRLVALDTYPTGLLVVTGLDAKNRALWEACNPIVREYVDRAYEELPDAVLRRDGAIPPYEALLASTLRSFREAREARSERES